MKEVGIKLNKVRLELLIKLLDEYIHTITERDIPLYSVRNPKQIEADEMITKIYETWGALEQAKFTKEIVCQYIQ